MRDRGSAPVPPRSVRRTGRPPRWETACAASEISPAVRFGSGTSAAASVAFTLTGSIFRRKPAFVPIPLGPFATRRAGRPVEPTTGRSAVWVSAGVERSRPEPRVRGMGRRGWATGEVGGRGVGTAPPSGDGGRDACPASSAITWEVGRFTRRLGAPRPTGPSSRRGEGVSAAPRRGSSPSAAAASVAASRVWGAVVSRWSAGRRRPPPPHGWQAGPRRVRAPT